MRTVPLRADPIRGIYPVLSVITAEGFRSYRMKNRVRCLPNSCERRVENIMAMPGMYVSRQLMQIVLTMREKGFAVSLAAVESKRDMAENASSTLRKSRNLCRIAFGGVGRYNEFDQLQLRVSDMRS